MKKQIHSGAYWMGLKLVAIRECFGGICAWKGCHSKDNLEFAHRHGYPTISGRGRGQWNRIKDIIKNPMNYILLCPAHHELYDRNHNEWTGQKQEIPA